jgi:hypothetical protein
MWRIFLNVDLIPAVVNGNKHFDSHYLDSKAVPCRYDSCYFSGVRGSFNQYSMSFIFKPKVVKLCLVLNTIIQLHLK